MPPLPSSAICNHLQRQNHSVENMEAMEFLTRVYADCIEIDTTYIEYRNHGIWPRLSYTAEVVGSSPIPPTQEPLEVGILCLDQAPW